MELETFSSLNPLGLVHNAGSTLLDSWQVGAGRKGDRSGLADRILGSLVLGDSEQEKPLTLSEPISILPPWSVFFLGGRERGTA